MTKNKTQDSKELTSLYDAFLALKTREECAAFMRDLCTLSELKEFAGRFAIAREIARGVSYRQIADDTDTSTTTVTRVAHWYQHGMGGYRTAIARITK